VLKVGNGFWRELDHVVYARDMLRDLGKIRVSKLFFRWLKKQSCSSRCLVYLYTKVFAQEIYSFHILLLFLTLDCGFKNLRIKSLKTNAARGTKPWPHR
jgi:hypothetical protein